MLSVSRYFSSKYRLILKNASIAAIVKNVSTTVPPATTNIKTGELNITFNDQGFIAVMIFR